MKKTLGQAVFSILALQICMAVAVIASQLPVSKDAHRTKKAEIVCQGASLGYQELKDEDGKVIASLVDVVNEDALGYMKNVPQDVIDYCHEEVAKLSKEDKLAMIQDK